MTSACMLPQPYSCAFSGVVVVLIDEVVLVDGIVIDVAFARECTECAHRFDEVVKLVVEIHSWSFVEVYTANIGKSMRILNPL